MKKLISLLTLTVALAATSYSQKPANTKKTEKKVQKKIQLEKRYNYTFKVQPIAGIDRFFALNNQELKFKKQLDAVDQSLNELNTYNSKSKAYIDFNKKNFEYNRARLISKTVKNKKTITKDTSLKTLPYLCNCILENDTININMSYGFASYAGYYIQLYPKGFQTNYYAYIDGVPIYKKDNSKDFSNTIAIGSQRQYMQLIDTPQFIAGATVTGMISYQSRPFLVKNHQKNQVDTISQAVDILFTCQVKEQPES